MIQNQITGNRFIGTKGVFYINVYMYVCILMGGYLTFLQKVKQLNLCYLYLVVEWASIRIYMNIQIKSLLMQ